MTGLHSPTKVTVGSPERSAGSYSRPLALCAALLGGLALLGAPAHAQQFNSDNYVTMPHGVATLITTVGERSSSLINTYALLPNWEFTLGGYVYDDDFQSDTDDGYSLTAYAKWMYYENEDKNAGLSLMGGTGLRPGHVDNGQAVDSLQTYWVVAPMTVPPLFDGKLSWDLMPGVSLDRDYGVDEDAAWGFTYSTRLALYGVVPRSAIVGEVFGATGEAESDPEYKAGVRVELTENVVFALTYGDTFDGADGAGIEFGFMFFTPPFLRL